MIRIFKSQIILRQLTSEQLEQLQQISVLINKAGSLPDTFGRDVKYDHPHTYPPQDVNLTVRQGDFITLVGMATEQANQPFVECHFRKLPA